MIGCHFANFNRSPSLNKSEIRLRGTPFENQLRLMDVFIVVVKFVLMKLQSALKKSTVSLLRLGLLPLASA